ncbi:MAG: hypothetical protein AMXMBFR53_01620 [Gemmatimonadota bacterium]
MDVDMALLADAATIDAAGKLNILGIFDRISTASFPAQHPQMVLILRFTASVQEMGRHHVAIALRDPRGQEAMRIDGDMHLGSGPGAVGEGIRVPHILHLDGLVFAGAGRYSFDVTVDGDHHVSVPLTVQGPAAAEA